MFSENNITTNLPRDLAHCTTLLINLTLAEHLQILNERRGVCSKVAFARQNQRYVWILKRSSLAAKVTAVSIETRVRSINWWQFLWTTVNFDLLLRVPKFFPQGISHTLSVGARQNLEVLGVWPIDSYSCKFRELARGSRDTMRRHTVHQSFTDALVKFWSGFSTTSPCLPIVMAAQWTGRYVLQLWFLPSFFPGQFSEVADWMSTIFRHMMWP